LAYEGILYLVIPLSAVVIASLVALIIREKKPSNSTEPRPPTYEFMKAPTGRTVERTVTNNMVREAKEKLRILNVEREILSYAIRRLYEAHAEGKITEEERDRLSKRYKEELKRINEDISRSETLITLDELERMQEDLVKLFNERFNELDKKIEELRKLTGLKVKPSPTAPKEGAKPSGVKEGRKPAQRERVKRPSRRRRLQKRTEADRRVEEIMSEVEKVLERLEQIEVEE